jgi:hypothetical protein
MTGENKEEKMQDNPEYAKWLTASQSYREAGYEYRLVLIDLTDKFKKLSALMTASDGVQREALAVIIDDYCQSAMKRFGDIMLAVAERHCGKQPEYLVKEKSEQTAAEHVQ